jgi:hypothetical protein
VRIEHIAPEEWEDTDEGDEAIQPSHVVALPHRVVEADDLGDWVTDLVLLYEVSKL